MGRAAQQTLTALLCIAAAVCMDEDSCPDVKIVGLSGSDKLAVLQGCPGMVGAAGPKGEPGAAGMKGDRGAEGIPGKAGPAGEKGEKGGVGLPGSQGIKGDSGASGKIGERGPPGIPGNAGQAGPKGERGPAGPPGVKGDKGASGTLGTVGERELDDIQCKKGAKNCKELLARGNALSGWYTIYPRDCNAITVLCDMDTDGGGWIVFQRRVDGSVDFYRDWNSYKRGFGSRLSEFWLGNDNIHLLTSLGTNELRVDLGDFENNYQFAIFGSFKITGETEKYKLMLGAFVNGTAGDSLTIHNQMPFTTQDRDNDLNSSNCATSYKGAWWYRECHSSNLNGLYLRGAHESYADGVNWKTGKGHKYSYKVSEMKFRPV